MFTLKSKQRSPGVLPGGQVKINVLLGDYGLFLKEERLIIYHTGRSATYQIRC